MTDKEDTKNGKKSIPSLKAIQGGAEGAAEATKGQEKRKYRDIHYQIALAMIGKSPNWHHPFPTKLHRIVDSRGENIFYEENSNKIVKDVCDAHINSLIANYWDKVLASGDRPIYLGPIAASDCDQIRKLWQVMAPGITQPFPLVTWASDPRPSHHKVPFDPLPIDQLQGGAPLFHEMLSRTTNAKALMAFIGSCFDSDSFRQQYSWIYGGGRNGKGALIRILGDLFGPTYASEEVPNADSKHWTSGLLGKRLVVFADCNNASFVTSGRFKSLTGEDKVRVEIKRGAILSTDLPCKYMFTSNAKPRISSSTADMRRIIYSYIAPVTKDKEIDDYEEHLLKEVHPFISACWWQYKELTGGNPRRKLEIENDDEVSDLARDSEHEYESFVDGRIHVVSYPDTTPLNARTHIRPERMKELMIMSGFKTPYEREGLRKYLERVHGVVCKQIKVSGQKPYPAFINCQLYPSIDSDGA